MKNLKILAVAVASILFIGMAHIVSACGPPPAPLRDRVEFSDLIVVAEVVDVTVVGPSEYENLNDVRVTLGIDEILKGVHPDESVYVTFRTYVGGVSTAPIPNYPEGERVLAFLYDPPSKTGTDYWTLSGKWGAITVNPETDCGDPDKVTPSELEVVRRRIGELMEIHQLEGEEREIATLDWIVGCASDPECSWWDGIQELHRRHRFDGGREPVSGLVDLASDLTPHHRQLLLDALRECNDDDRFRALGLATVLMRSDPEEVAGILLDRLATRGEPWHIAWVPRTIARGFDDQDLLDVSQLIEECRAPTLEEYEEELNELYRLFVELANQSSSADSL